MILECNREFHEKSNMPGFLRSGHIILVYMNEPVCVFCADVVHASLWPFQHVTRSHSGTEPLWHVTMRQLGVPAMLKL